MNVSEIRSAWLKSWRDAAEKDEGEWICSLFETSKDEAEQLTEDMLALISKIPVEEDDVEDKEYDLNYILHWQAYGIDVNEDELATLYFQGARRGAIFIQIDSISDLPLKEFIDISSAKKIAIELPVDARNSEDMKDAIEFFEEGLGLEPDVFEESSHLPWTGDDTKVVLHLNKGWIHEALEEAAAEDEFYEDG